MNVGCPESEIVAQELHDESGVLVGLLVEGVELGNGVVEGGLGQAARTIGRVQDLVVEDGEVERQSEPDRMRGHELAGGNVTGRLVGDETVLGRLLAIVAGGELGQVSVVVALHLVVEDLGLASAGVRYEVLVEQAEYVGTDLLELLLDLRAIGAHERIVAALLLLLDGAGDAPRGASRTNHVLVRHAEQVALLDGQLGVVCGHHLHRLEHLVVAFGLLG